VALSCSENSLKPSSKTRSVPGLLAESISRQLIEKEINGCDPAVSGDDEISAGERWLLTRSALDPSDSPGIAHFLGLTNWLIPKVRVLSPKDACNEINLIASSVYILVGFIENDIFGVYLVDRCTPALAVVFTENVLKIACQQSGYTLRHDLSPSGLRCIFRDPRAIDCAPMILAPTKVDPANAMTNENPTRVRATPIFI
jgi:hypothetical protein